jgi:hypothetical protein
MRLNFSFTKTKFLATALFLFSGCAFNDKGADSNRQRNLEDREKLVREFSAIQGIYEGDYETTRRNSANQVITEKKVQILLAYRETATGRNRDGEIVYLPILTGKFLRPEAEDFDVSLDASYIPETGDLTLTTKAEKAPPEKDDKNIALSIASGFQQTQYYIRGTINSNRFEAPVRGNDGVLLGRLRLQRTTSEVNGPRSGEEIDDYDRAKARIIRFQGKYLGRIAKSSTIGEFKIKMEIRVVDELVSGRLVPKLQMFSLREDGFSKTARHSISYLNERGFDELIFSPAKDAVGFSYFTLNGRWESGKIRGVINYPTFSSDFSAEPVKP